jgi:glycosyltransferase involved in cell wall biosynthesis
MKKVLFVVPSLQPCGAAKQLTLLAPGLPPQKFALRVCVLGRDGPFAQPLRDAGVPVDVLGWRRRFDLGRVLGLRKRVRDFDPDVIHVWGVPALALLRFAGGRSKGASARQIVVSRPLAPGKGSRRQGWLLRQADRVVVNGPAEAERCRRLGVLPARISLVAPAVGQAPTRQDSDLRRFLRLPAQTRLILCVGPLEPHKGFVEAVWAYHTLTYVYTDMSLLVIGGGSERRLLEQLARRSALPAVFFLGPQANAAALLAQADIVWVPSLTDSGLNVLLEAMAAGRPVVASRLASLSEIVEDGHSGLLVPAGDKVAIARQTRLLLNSPQRRYQLGEEARGRVTTQFSVESLCRRFIRLYDALLPQRADLSALE